MGLVIVLVLVVAASAGLWLAKVRGAMLQIAAAGLLFGAAGYSIQGRPGMAGESRAAARAEAPIPLTRFRHAFFGQFSSVEHWLRISESYARRGRTADSVGVLESALRQHPASVALWVGQGNALFDHAQALTPAAELAFRRAQELAPGHPAPAFFYGLALARSGDRQGALQTWRSILETAPSDASWRGEIENLVAALEAPPAR